MLDSELPFELPAPLNFLVCRVLGTTVVEQRGNCVLSLTKHFWGPRVSVSGRS